jgi:hypothetical protein
MPFSGDLAQDSPALWGTVNGWLSAAELERLGTLYRVIMSEGGLDTPGIIREVGVSFNPRPARVAGIVVTDAGLRTGSAIGAVFELCRAPSNDEKSEHTQPVRGLLRGERCNDPAAIAIAAAFALDDLRHLHMTDLTVAERKQRAVAIDTNIPRQLRQSLPTKLRARVEAALDRYLR